MDIEGSEVEALNGMEDVLKQKEMRLIIAAYHPVNGKPTNAAIVPYLEKLGFTAVYLPDGMVRAKR